VLEEACPKLRDRLQLKRHRVDVVVLGGLLGGRERTKGPQRLVFGTHSK
jgi:hypothetical protein